MGKAAVNIATQGRQISSNFSEQNPSRTIGPLATESAQVASNGESISVTDASLNSTIINWQPMSRFTEELKNAVIDWIDTTKEGVKVAHEGMQGRQKTMIFDFYGNATKSVKPGEIGQFNVIFSYPPTVSTQNPPGQPGTISTPSNNTQA
jgi:hypothetical protein